LVLKGLAVRSAATNLRMTLSHRDGLVNQRHEILQSHTNLKGQVFLQEMHSLDFDLPLVSPGSAELERVIRCNLTWGRKAFSILMVITT
jgi:hypothetical protein